MEVLEVRDVVKAFGGIRAVDRCTLSVRPGTITGLIGPNGAGKSTLFNVVAGLQAADSGEVWLRGERIDGFPPHEIVRRGLVKTFQIPRELQNMTVLENLMVAAQPGPGESLLDLVRRPFDIRRAERDLVQRAQDVLALVGMSHLRDEYARNLSGGQKKLLELARSLVAAPKVVLLDEPVAGVNPTLARKILEVVEGLRRDGLTVFLIEHDMDVVMRRCEWIIVMHQGRVLMEGIPQEIKADARVIEAYLGS